MIEAKTPFLERAHQIALAVGAASLLFGLVWAVAFDESDFVATHGADGFSRSSIGFRAFGELLERNGIEVVRSRFRSAARAGAGDVLVLAAPGGESTNVRNGRAQPDDVLKDALEKAPRVLLVLPKWRPGADDDADEGELASVAAVDDGFITAIAQQVAPGAALVRVAEPSFALNAFGATPELQGGQLLRDASITPLLSGDDGLLVGSTHRDERQQMILTDPDVISNGGLARGENAALALALIDALRGEGGRVLFDETEHGFERTPSIWRELGRAPLKMGSAHLLALALAALLAGAVRFGRPRRVRAGWREGKQALLDNTAELMELVGHAPSALARYFDATIERLAEALHVPGALDRRDRTQRLEARLSPEHRTMLTNLAGDVKSADGDSLRELAARIHRFREEVLHGAR